MDMNISEFLPLFIKLNERLSKAKSWDMWIAMLPHMGEKFVPFSEFIEQKEEGVYADQVFI